MSTIIRKTKMSMVLAVPTIEIEVRYTNRPDFKKLMEQLRNNEFDCVVMPRLVDLSRNPEDVKAACREIKAMHKKVKFIIDHLTGNDVLKMSYNDILKITTSTLKEDIVVIVDTPEEAQNILKNSVKGTAVIK